MESSVTIMPYMMDSGEERIVADAIFEGLTRPGITRIRSFQPRAGAGAWQLDRRNQIFARHREQHFKLEQIGNDLTGAQQGELYKTAIQGSVHVNQIELRSAMSVSGNAIPWTFKGEVQGTRWPAPSNLRRVRRSRLAREPR